MLFIKRDRARGLKGAMLFFSLENCLFMTATMDWLSVEYDPGSLEFLSKCEDDCHNGIQCQGCDGILDPESGPRTCKLVSPMQCPISQHRIRFNYCYQADYGDPIEVWQERQHISMSILAAAMSQTGQKGLALSGWFAVRACEVIQPSQERPAS